MRALDKSMQRGREKFSRDNRDQLLETLVSVCPIAIVVIDGDAIVKLWNPAAERLFGWAASDIVGHALPIELPPEVVRGEAAGRIEVHSKRRNDSPLHLAVLVSPLAAQASTVVLMFSDWSQTAPAEELRSRLGAIVESSEDAIVGKTLEGIITSWNAGAERIFGYTADEMIGKSILHIVPPDRTSDVSQILAAIGRGDRVEHFECERVRKDGKRISVSLTVSPIRDAAGHIIGASKIARDVTEVKRAEREQRRTLRELTTLYAVGQALAAEHDRDRVLQTITDAATDLSGAQFGAFVYNAAEGDLGNYTFSNEHRDASDDNERASGGNQRARLFVLPFSETIVVRIADIRLNRQYRRMIENRANADVNSALASYLAVPVISRTGDVLGGLRLGHADVGVFTEEAERIVVTLATQAAVALDNSRFFESERRARASAEEASRAKDQFLAMLGHELRTPLSSIRNALTTAVLDPAKSPRALEIACHGAEQLTRLVDDLLDVARITRRHISLRREVVSFNEIVERAVDSVRPLFNERGLLIILSLPKFRLEVNGDPARLEQVVGNLLTNAVKFSEPEQAGSVTISLDYADDRAVLRVRDTGIGISADLLPRVFDLFVQGEQSLDRTRGGLGIGLTLVKQIVDMHSGEVEVRSEGLGHGAEFIVRLPAIMRTAKAQAKRPKPSSGGAANSRVLIVEDNSDSAESLMVLLELFGLRVCVVNDGTSALEAARTNRPDVMLIDIGLPGMNGYQLAEKVRDDEMLRGITLIALTGYGQEEDRMRALAAGFDYHLVKPIDIEKIESLVAGIDPSLSIVHSHRSASS